MKLYLFFIPLIAWGISCTTTKTEILSIITDPKKESFQFYWKGTNGVALKSLGKLKEQIDANGQQLVFAMNGGMYDEQNKPIGLYIEKGTELIKLNTTTLKPTKNWPIPNFYLQPNGVFYITKNNIAQISKTTEFKNKNDVAYATQSGPLLVINGNINPIFEKNSDNRKVRNGVGILPNNHVVFAISTGKINFYDFAAYFEKLGCKNALYLDGYVSKIYFPEKNQNETGGNFGVMIGITKNK